MSPRSRHSDVRLVGLVFCQPHSKFAKEEILPALRYFNLRSGERVNFYFAGYRQGNEAPPGDVMAVPPTDMPGWVFSARDFNGFREFLEKTTNWKYGGGSELVLANSHYDSELDDVYLDFKSAICISFERLKHDGALPDVGILFEEIFRYAETCNAVDPTWGFSDHAAQNLMGNALKSLVVSVLPKAFSQNAKTAFHFVSSNLGRNVFGKSTARANR